MNKYETRIEGFHEWLKTEHGHHLSLAIKRPDSRTRSAHHLTLLKKIPAYYGTKRMRDELISCFTLNHLLKKLYTVSFRSRKREKASLKHIIIVCFTSCRSSPNRAKKSWEPHSGIRLYSDWFAHAISNLHVEMDLRTFNANFGVMDILFYISYCKDCFYLLNSVHIYLFNKWILSHHYHFFEQWYLTAVERIAVPKFPYKNLKGLYQIAAWRGIQKASKCCYKYALFHIANSI